MGMRPFAGYFIERLAPLFVAIAAAILLAGCSGMRIVDSQVAAFSKLEALPAASSWRFERLPSQQNLSESQATRQLKLEALAAQELAKFGFKPQPEATSAAAKYSIQLSSRFQRLARGPYDPALDIGTPYYYGGFMSGRDYVVTGSGRVIYAPVFPYLPPPWYVREVGLIVRDTTDNRVVYETQARHEGNWANDEAVLPAMLSAALKDFPKPPEGKRMVNVEIPR